MKANKMSELDWHLQSFKSHLELTDKVEHKLYLRITKCLRERYDHRGSYRIIRHITDGIHSETDVRYKFPHVKML